MLIFLQELIMLLFIWFLRLIDGIMDIFSTIAGVTDVVVKGERVNIIEYIVGNSAVGTIFWSVFILAIGLTCIFGIVALVKNMITSNRNITTIIGKIGLSLLGSMAMLTVVVLGILISNSILALVGEIFQINNTTKLSTALFNACVGEWLNGYTMTEVDITSCSVSEIMGDYNSIALGIWPTSWKCNGMINPETFLYLPSMIASIALLISMVIAIINLSKRLYEIILMYIIMPVSMSTLPLDDGARFKVWRETFITKIILAYGTVFSVNIFILILPIVTKMQVDGVGGFGNALFLIFMIVGGAMVIPAGQNLFARLFGQADDMHAGGSFLHSAFYGGRIASALTFGAALKLVKGGVGMGKGLVSRIKGAGNDNSSLSQNDQGDKYSEGIVTGGANNDEGEKHEDNT